MDDEASRSIKAEQVFELMRCNAYTSSFVWCLKKWWLDEPVDSSLAEIKLDACCVPAKWEDDLRACSSAVASLALNPEAAAALKRQCVVTTVLAGNEDFKKAFDASPSAAVALAEKPAVVEKLKASPEARAAIAANRDAARRLVKWPTVKHALVKRARTAATGQPTPPRTTTEAPGMLAANPLTASALAKSQGVACTFAEVKEEVKTFLTKIVNAANKPGALEPLKQDPKALAAIVANPKAAELLADNESVAAAISVDQAALAVLAATSATAGVAPTDKGEGCIKWINSIFLKLHAGLKKCGPCLTLLLVFTMQLGLPAFLIADQPQSFNPFACHAGGSRLLHTAKVFVAVYILYWVLWRDCTVFYQLTLNAARLDQKACKIKNRVGMWAGTVILSLFYFCAILLVLWVSLNQVARSDSISGVILNGISALFILDADDLFVAVEEEEFKAWTEAVRRRVTADAEHILTDWRQPVFIGAAWGLVIGCVAVWTFSLVCIFSG